MKAVTMIEEQATSFIMSSVKLLKA